jgi:hypothetical protein
MSARKVLLRHQTEDTGEEGRDLVGEEISGVLERCRRQLRLQVERAA